MPKANHCARGQEHAPHLWMLGRVAYSCDGESRPSTLVPDAVLDTGMTVEQAHARIHILYTEAIWNGSDSLHEDVQAVLKELMGDGGTTHP